jgi:hypothetical protein
MDGLRYTNANRSALRRSVALGAHGSDAGNEERDGEQRALRSGRLHAVTSEVALLQLMTENQ